MDWMTIAEITAGAYLGLKLYELYTEKIKPILRASKETAIPLKKINSKIAVHLDSFLQDWTYIFQKPYELLDEEKFRLTLPSEVEEAFNQHINNKGIHLYASLDDPVESWKRLFDNKAERQKRVHTFYQEAAVKQYLRER